MLAGIGIGGLIQDLDVETYFKETNVDLLGVMLCMNNGVPRLPQAGRGRCDRQLVVGRWHQRRRWAAARYTAAKHGVVGATLTKTGAIEGGPHGIRVNAICPGFILSEIMGQNGLNSPWGPELLKKATLGRAGQPAEVAEVAVFLALRPGVVRQRRHHPGRWGLVRPARLNSPLR